MIHTGLELHDSIAFLGELSLLKPRMSTTQNLIETWIFLLSRLHKAWYTAEHKMLWNLPLSLLLSHINCERLAVKGLHQSHHGLGLSVLTKQNYCLSLDIYVQKALTRQSASFLFVSSVHWPLTSMWHYKRKRSEAWQLWKDNAYKSDTWTKCRKL